jgi:hypothetical protein
VNRAKAAVLEKVLRRATLERRAKWWLAAAALELEVKPDSPAGAAAATAV